MPGAAAPYEPSSKLALLVPEGDGIGPEIAAATVAVLTRVAQLFGLVFEPATIGHGTRAFTQSVIAALEGG